MATKSSFKPVTFEKNGMTTVARSEGRVVDLRANGWTVVEPKADGPKSSAPKPDAK